MRRRRKGFIEESDPRNTTAYHVKDCLNMHGTEPASLDLKHYS